MAIYVARYADEPNILWWRFDGRWSWRNLDEALFQTRYLTGASGERINVILDVREMGLPPADMVSQLRQRARCSLVRHRIGVNVVVGADYYLTLLWTVASDYFPEQWQIRFADSLPDACAVIRASRPILKNIPKSRPLTGFPATVTMER